MQSTISIISDASGERSERNPIVKFLWQTSELEIRKTFHRGIFQGFTAVKYTLWGLQRFRGTCQLLPRSSETLVNNLWDCTVS
jgi:hypothetical protein